MSDGAVERSGKSGQANDLAEGAGETVPLKANENFEGRPHPYRVIERNGWSYVVPALMVPMPHHSGPWRYKSEAEDYADELNAGKAV